MVIANCFRYPESNIKFEQRNIRAVLDKKDLGLGTLFVSERTLCWQEKDNAGFSVEYQDISLHAISKDENVYPKECIYLMLDGKLTMPGDASQNLNHNDEDDDSDAESEHEVTELILVPSDENETAVSSIYDAIKVCQELNPDPEDMDEDDDNLYADAEDELEEEGHYVIQNRGAGDADIDDISRRIEENSFGNGDYLENGNEDDEFQDAD
ncbi:methylosome subunit pICln-like [Anthonomus grandis grandis]|uniref:methylosome subunit pICln-like n=1 Tax=Anthonomus grandis grandis TaxID=2921223 RepID=UPI0021666C41|nr:methylosome subunit pICln-like [Anthonomus grandis grandis]